ncbi:hypothetical protein [Halorubrum trueperi]|uniref:Uncharacterized protein n=1 Tax=Halorubrum trueperi TaxID=2004704 RepID=A0ABD5UDN9_9EURY
MFDLFKDNNSEPVNRGIDEEFSFEFDSRDARSEAVDWDGAVSSEELAKDPETVDTEEGEVVSLGKFANDETVLELGADTIELSLSEIETHSSFFHPDEIEELSREKHHTNESQKDSIDKVEEALNDPEYPNTRRELWNQLAKDEGKFGLGQEEDLTEAEKDAKTVEALERRGIDASPSHPENKQVQEMSGSELKEVMQNALGDSEPQEEELSEPETPEEIEEPEINSPEVDEFSEGARAWEELGGVWSDFASDLEASSEVPDTEVTTLSDGSKLIKTSYDDLKVELWEMDSKNDKKSKILDKSGSVLKAIIAPGESYD